MRCNHVFLLCFTAVGFDSQPWARGYNWACCVVVDMHTVNSLARDVSMLELYQLLELKLINCIQLIYYDFGATLHLWFTIVFDFFKSIQLHHFDMCITKMRKLSGSILNLHSVLPIWIMAGSYQDRSSISRVFWQYG